MALLSVFADGRFATARPRLVAGLFHQKGALSSVVRRVSRLCGEYGVFTCVYSSIRHCIHSGPPHNNTPDPAAGLRLQSVVDVGSRLFGRVGGHGWIARHERSSAFDGLATWRQRGGPSAPCPPPSAAIASHGGIACSGVRPVYDVKFCRRSMVAVKLL